MADRTFFVSLSAQEAARLVKKSRRMPIKCLNRIQTKMALSNASLFTKSISFAIAIMLH